MEYKISGQISYDDFMQFQQFNLKSAINKLFSRWQKIIVFVSLGIYFINELRKDNNLQKIVIFIIIISLFIFFSLIIYYSKSLYKKQFNIDKSNALYCNYTINENGIIIEFEDGIINLSKDDIHKILFDNDSIYIYQWPNIAKIIKKRFFEDETEYTNLLLFINEKYAEKVNNK